MADATAEPVVVTPAAEEILAEILQLEPAEVLRIRGESPPRRRPRRQAGPTADYA